MKDGALYIATGESYVEQAITSGKTLQERADLPISIVTGCGSADRASSSDVFDGVIVLESEENGLRDKIRGMRRTPYQRTIFIDADTIVTEDPSPAFELLNKFDLAASHAPKRRSVTIESVPNAFPEYNTGVLVFNQSSEIDEMFNRWETIHQNQVENGRPDEMVLTPGCTTMEEIALGRGHDQPPFRQAVYESNIQVATLPREYNFRGRAAYAYESVKILHMGHSRRAVELANVINSNIGDRTYISGRKSILHGDGDVERLKFSRLEYFAKKLGLVGILDRVGAKSVVKSVVFKKR
jgi:hypothetical protein